MTIILLSLLLYYLTSLAISYYKKKRTKKLNKELNALHDKPKHPLHITVLEKQPDKLLEKSEATTTLRYIGIVKDLVYAERKEGNYARCKGRDYIYINGKWEEIGSFSV